MKRLETCLVACLILAAGVCSARGRPDAGLRVMTFNVRYDTPADSLNAWPHRREFAASMIRFHQADLAGLQEALSGQVEDLARLLQEYGWFGVGRDDGREAGEFMAVFYLKDRLRVLESGTFWLSENPGIPGRGWDAACNRVVTWGRFADRQTGKRFLHFNTHFDHMGMKAREESVKLLLKRADAMAGGSPVTVTGDFNSTPDSEVYRILTRGLEGRPASGLTDAKMASAEPHHGPLGTFTAFRLANLAGNDSPIDFVFV